MKLNVSRNMFAVFALAIVGCGPNISMTRMNGAIYDAKPVGCAIKFEQLDFQQASAQYKVIGMITLTGTKSSGLDADTKRIITQKACELGADAVTLNAASDTGSAMVGGMIQFLALRTPESTAPPAQ